MNAIIPASGMSQRVDGMMNVLNMMARTQPNSFAAFFDADRLYSADGLAATIVDKPAEDVMGAGFEIEGDENNDILNEFDRLDAIPIITDAIRWTRLHGGGAILMLLADGLPLTEPVNLARLRKIEDLMVYSSSAISPTSVRYTDPLRKNFGWPALYDVRPMQGNSFTVHETRLIKMAGDPLPYSTVLSRGLPWIGRSALESCYKDIERYRTGLCLSQGILERKTQLVHKMSDLGTMLSSGQDDVVAKRLQMADAARNIFTMLAVDALDDVVLADTSVGGIDAIIRDFRVAIAASSRMPLAVLFGEHVAGLNANAQGDLSIYYDLLRGIQKRRLIPTIERLAKVIWSQSELSATEPERWLVKLNPLFTPQPADVADVENKRANSRKLTIEAVNVASQMGAWTPEEVRNATALAFPELGIVLNTGLLPDDMLDGDTAGEPVQSIAMNAGGTDPAAPVGVIVGATGAEGAT
jgi:phage-related protein (TIGR01555 family)